MAEAPEVENYVRDAQHSLVGKTIADAMIERPETVRFPAPTIFAEEIAGARIAAVSRRAKWMLVALSGDRTLAIHLMLFGSLRLESSAAPVERSLCVALRLDSDEELRLLDRMGYARVALAPTTEIGERLHLDSLGPDILAPDFSAATLEARLARKRTPIKPTLLDQHVAAGMGNRDADESLWRARIDPRRPAGTLTHEEAARLTVAMQSVLREGIAHGGTMTDLHGRQGTQRDYIQVFEHAGKPCPRCGAPIERLRLQNRNTFDCPRCQQ